VGGWRSCCTPRVSFGSTEPPLAHRPVKSAAAPVRTTVFRDIVAMYTVSDLHMISDNSRARAGKLVRVLFILAYTLGTQDLRNVTTRVKTWHPRGLRCGLRLPVRRESS